MQRILFDGILEILQRAWQIVDYRFKDERRLAGRVTPE